MADTFVAVSETVKLHEAIVEVLSGGEWRTWAEVADLVNAAGRYEKGDGSPVEPDQVRLRATASGGRYGHLFDVDGGRIRLASTE